MLALEFHIIILSRYYSYKIDLIKIRLRFLDNDAHEMILNAHWNCCHLSMNLKKKVLVLRLLFFLVIIYGNIDDMDTLILNKTGELFIFFKTILN